MATKIIMYTGDNCGKCKRAKAMLESCPVDVEIVECNVDKREEDKFYLKDVLNSQTLPTFVLQNGEVLRGFDENIGKIMEALGL